jgi:hypothetical protein
MLHLHGYDLLNEEFLRVQRAFAFASSKVTPDAKNAMFNCRSLKYLMGENLAYYDTLRNLLNALNSDENSELSAYEMKGMLLSVLHMHLKNLGDYFGGQVLKKTDKKEKRLQLCKIDRNSLDIVLSFLEPDDWNALSKLSTFWRNLCDSLLMQEVTFQPDKQDFFVYFEIWSLRERVKWCLGYKVFVFEHQDC